MPTRRAMLKSAAGLALTGAVGATGSSALAEGTRGRGKVRDADKWQRLRAGLKGELVRPGDATYEHAKTVYLGEYSTTNPQAVAYCTSVKDVQACVRFARDYGVELRTRSGGHNLAGWSTGEGLVMDLSRFNQAVVTGKTVHVGPGAMSIDALTALAPAGRQIVTGTCPTVCPGGFISGGGVGFQTRKYGTASDRLVAAKVVLADGRVVLASETSEPDLFWALRGGGGGNFGVVLDFEVLPVDQPRGVYFDTVWSWDKAAEVIAAWQRWSVAASHDLGSSLLVSLPDAAPGAMPTIMLTGAYWGPQRELEAGLDALAAEARTKPTTREVRELSYDDVMRQVYGCGQSTARECHLVGQNPDAELPRNGTLRERTRIFDRPVVGSVLDRALAALDTDRRAGETRLLSFTATGGRANEVSRTATAYWHRNAQFMTGFAALTQRPSVPAEEEAAMVAWVDRGYDILEPVSAHESYINFPDTRLTDWQRAYYGGNYPRLLGIKRRYDPANLFHHPQSVGS